VPTSVLPTRSRGNHLPDGWRSRRAATVGFRGCDRPTPRLLDDERPRRVSKYPAGGPFDAAAVSISAAAEPGRLVEASWKRDGERMASETLDDFEEARTLAHVWADQLAAGIEPETT